LLTQPVFQVFASGGLATSGTPTVQPISAFDRGQASAARTGGVELSRTSGSKSTSSSAGGPAEDICKALMSAPRSDASLLQMLVNGCGLGKGRVSWRQLK
jgi:hypothetical protein